MNGFGFFKIYHALDLHLNTERYDVFKYMGRTKAKAETFALRRDKSRFEYWANKIKNDKKAGKFCIANFIHGNSNWIYEFYDQGEEAFQKWTKIKESQSKMFEDDLGKIQKLAEKHELSFIRLFEKTPSGKYPPLLQILNTRLILPETGVILNQKLKCFDKWQDICHTDPYVDEKLMRLRKYTPFVKYDDSKIQQSLERFARNVKDPKKV